jgi:hypothetical protein
VHIEMPVTRMQSLCSSFYLLLGWPIGRRQAAGPPVLIDGRAVDHNGVLCSGIALGEDAIQHLVFHSLQDVHLQNFEL